MLKVAAETFALMPRAGSEGRTLLGNTASTIFMPLKSTIVLLEQGDEKLVLLTSHLMTHYYRFSNILRRHVAAALGLDRARVLVFSSHNHCSVKLNRQQYSFGLSEHDVELPDEELTPEGAELVHSYVAAAKRLPNQLQAVQVRYGRGHERRISHNRKGRRADGSTYLMREEDRLTLGVDFHGDIDDDAFVVGFLNGKNQPVCFLTQFTAHPVTAFHCDHPVVHGEFPQVACDDLAAAFGNVPTAFLQGCAGDINSKGLLSTKTAQENARDAERYGHCLGETFIKIARELKPSERDDLDLVWRWVAVPFKDVPPAEELRARLAAVEGFLQRCAAGELDSTRACDGLNFPTNMTVPYRQALIAPVKRWLEWALSFHTQQRLDQAPREVSIHMAALRIGDVGIVGMPCEPFLGIGRQIKQAAPLPLVLPCGYMNDTSIAYVPDGPNCDDAEYMSQFCRYTTSLLPYRRPAGDCLATAAVQMLSQLAQTPVLENTR